MKFLAALLLLAVSASAINHQLQCSLAVPDLPHEWITMEDTCIIAMKKQIQKEFDASYQYLAMGAHFSRDTVNRPGFAETFFKAAKEEREHGSKLIEYLSMRGELTSDVTSLFKEPRVSTTKWADGVAALKDALNLETEVTKSIRSVIKDCEASDNDYHLVDYLTGVYLEEQYEGQRDLAGKLSTLKKMNHNHGNLGEFLFDKTLL